MKNLKEPNEETLKEPNEEPGRKPNEEPEKQNQMKNLEEKKNTK
jgi:hypothetical protein